MVHCIFPAFSRQLYLFELVITSLGAQAKGAGARLQQHVLCTTRGIHKYAPKCEERRFLWRRKPGESNLSIDNPGKDSISHLFYVYSGGNSTGAKNPRFANGRSLLQSQILVLDKRLWPYPVSRLNTINAKLKLRGNHHKLQTGRALDQSSALECSRPATANHLQLLSALENRV